MSAVNIQSGVKDTLLNDLNAAASSFNRGSFGSGANQLQQFIQEENPTTQNHELRLTSNNDSPLFWQIGLFYFKEKNSPLDSGLFIESGPFADQYLIRFNYNVETESKAAFGQVSYNVTDAVKLSAGVRYTEDSKTRTGDATLDLHVASAASCRRASSSSRPATAT